MVLGSSRTVSRNAGAKHEGSRARGHSMQGVRLERRVVHRAGSGAREEVVACARSARFMGGRRVAWRAAGSAVAFAGSLAGCACVAGAYAAVGCRAEAGRAARMLTTHSGK